jgi:hypothetical protein
MLKPGGYAFTFGPNGVQQELDTFTCCHCNSVVHIKPKCNPADLGGQCRLCDKPICPRCLGKGCTPFEKRLEQVEARDRALRSYQI